MSVSSQQRLPQPHIAELIGSQTTPTQAMHCSSRQPDSRPWTDVVYNWQSLEAGGLAIAAAVIGAIFLRRQTAQAAEHEKDRIAASLAAARATMPLSLSSLSEFTSACAVELHKANALAKDGRLHSDLSALPIPALPLAAVDGLQDLVRYGTDDVSTSVSNLISSMQVFVSRIPTSDRHELSAASGVRSGALSVWDSIFDLGIVDAHVRALYDYGRRITKTVDPYPSWRLVRVALNSLGFRRERFANIHDRLEVYERQGAPADVTNRSVLVKRLEKDMSQMAEN